MIKWGIGLFEIHQTMSQISAFTYMGLGRCFVKFLSLIIPTVFGGKSHIAGGAMLGFLHAD
jgi:hypothetical protein